MEKKPVLVGFILLAILACIFIFIGAGESATTDRAGSDIQQAREQIESATESVGNAETGLNRAGAGVDQAISRTERIKESVKDSTDRLAESQQLIAEIYADNERARRIVESMRAGDKESATQDKTGETATTGVGTSGGAGGKF